MCSVCSAFQFLPHFSSPRSTSFHLWGGGGERRESQVPERSVQLFPPSDPASCQSSALLSLGPAPPGDFNEIAVWQMPLIHSQAVHHRLRGQRSPSSVPAPVSPTGDGNRPHGRPACHSFTRGSPTLKTCQKKKVVEVDCAAARKWNLPCFGVILITFSFCFSFVEGKQVFGVRALVLWCG